MALEALPEVASLPWDAASMAVTHLLDRLGVRPDMAARHSYAEYVALCVAGVLGEKDLYRPGCMPAAGPAARCRRLGRGDSASR